MAQTKRLVLGDRNSLNELACAGPLVRLLVFTAALHNLLQLLELAEVPHALFLSNRNRDALRTAGGGLLRDQLNSRGIHHRRKLLSHRFRRRKKRVPIPAAGTTTVFTEPLIPGAGGLVEFRIEAKPADPHDTILIRPGRATEHTLECAHPNFKNAE